MTLADMRDLYRSKERNEEVIQGMKNELAIYRRIHKRHAVDAGCACREMIDELTKSLRMVKLCASIFEDEV